MLYGCCRNRHCCWSPSHSWDPALMGAGCPALVSPSPPPASCPPVQRCLLPASCLHCSGGSCKPRGLRAGSSGVQGRQRRGGGGSPPREAVEEPRSGRAPPLPAAGAGQAQRGRDPSALPRAMTGWSSSAPGQGRGSEPGAEAAASSAAQSGVLGSPFCSPGGQSACCGVRRETALPPKSVDACG